MTKTMHFARIALAVLLLLSWSNRLLAQPLDYHKAMEEIMDNYLSDYPQPTIKAFDSLFAGINVDELPAKTSFLYYYYYGRCLEEIDPDDALLYLTQARKIASSNRDVGIQRFEALDAEKALADLYLAQGTEESKAAAMLLYNDIITVGISLLKDSDIFGLVIMSMIEQAKMGVTIWLDSGWVEKIWIQVRDLALELNDGTYYSYYVLNVLNYYCDLGEYDTALSFMEDAKNKDILQVDASSFCQHILKTKSLLSKNETLEATFGVHSLEYWANKLELATLSTALCSEEKSTKLLQEVEQGLVDNKLTQSYEYAQALFLLSNQTMSSPAIAEKYLSQQIYILNTRPEYFIYTTDIEVYNSLGVCQMKQCKYTDAQTSYTNALNCLERDSDYSDSPGYKNLQAIVYHNVGRNLFYLGKYKESVDYFNKSISLQEEVTGTVMPKSRVYLSETLGQLKVN